MDSGYYVFDCETDALDHGGGLLSTDASVVHCMVLHDLALKKSWHNDIHTGFERAREAFATAKMLVCHNILGFDQAVLQRLLGFVIPPDCIIVDTYVWSQALYPDRGLYDGKGHGLDPWGERLGIPKPPITDYTVYNPEKLHRCYEDVRINVGTYKELLTEAKMYDSGQFLWLEQEITKITNLQEKRGQQLDIPLTQWLEKELTAWLVKMDDDLRQHFGGRVVAGGHRKAIWKATGQYRLDVLKWFGPQMIASRNFSFGTEPDADGALFCDVFFEPINLGSNEQVIKLLTGIGWEPISRTPKGNPQVTEESLEIWAHDMPGVKSIIRRRMLVHRLGMVKGWLRDVDEDGRIRGRVNAQGAVTLRMTHQKVVNVSKFKKTEPYSEYYRQCFIATKDPSIPEWSYEHTDPRTKEVTTRKVTGQMAQVGCDAAGLENRMLANRMNDPELTEIICNPEQDFHTFMWKTVEEYFDSRDTFKNWEYAFFYGAGDLKLGAMASVLDVIQEEEAIGLGWHYVESGKSKGLWKCGEQKALPWRGLMAVITGQRIRARVMAGLPSLDALNTRVQEICRQGFLVGFDGRRLIMRVGYDHQVQTHKGLNTLLQGDGALIMKMAQYLLNETLKAKEIPFWFLQTVHDEFQGECLPEHRDYVAGVMRQSIIQAGLLFNLNCPLDATAQIGVNWGETH